MVEALVLRDVGRGVEGDFESSEQASHPKKQRVLSKPPLKGGRGLTVIARLPTRRKPLSTERERGGSPVATVRVA